MCSASTLPLFGEDSWNGTGQQFRDRAADATPYVAHVIISARRHPVKDSTAHPRHQARLEA
ncbi:MAG: hypothetical protein V3U08_08765, partial [Nitrospirales bacterium]